MMNQTSNNRTIKNATISFVKKQYYSIYERIRLSLERFKYNRSHCRDNPESEPLIFVYIPTYNRGNILMERALPSVLNQTYKNIKVFVVGDGCSDNTEELISKVNDDRVQFVNLFPRIKRNWPDEPFYHWLSGSVIPSNFALENVEGSYIAKIDDDDEWTEKHLERSLEFLDNNNFEFITSGMSSVVNGNSYIQETHYALDKYYTLAPLPSVNKGPKMGAPSSLFYKSYLSFIKYNEDAWRKKWNKNHDIDFIQRVYKANVRIGYNDEVLCKRIPLPGRTFIGSKGIDEKKEGELY
jgi:glycosyltransferase involved in cell wall biosynthesis